MIKSAFQFLSFSALVLAGAAASSAAAQAAPLPVSMKSLPGGEVVCRAPQDVERGWESQLELLEARLAARAPEGIEVKGAIITAPFPTFPAYRRDLPSQLADRVTSAPTEAPRRSVDHLSPTGK